MRVLVACAVMLGCHATAPAPHAAVRLAVTASAADPPPSPHQAFTTSFLERVSPHTIDVPHVNVAVERREGPDAIDDQLPAVSAQMRKCYTDTWILYAARREYHLTMTVDARRATTEVDIEPADIAQSLGACFVQSLVSSHFDAGRARVVLAIDARVWLTTTNVQPGE